MNSTKSPLKLTYLIFGLWLIAQIIVVVWFWGVPQKSDQGVYMDIAKACFDKGEWYPLQSSVYASYIWTAGFINFLILQLKLFGTMNTNMIFNLIMNIGIAVEIFCLGKRFFSVRTANIAVILWCLLYSNLMIVAPAGTEIPFLFLALSAFCLCLFYPKPLFMAIAGVLFILANWVRPLAIIFIFTIIIYMLWKKYSWKNFAALFVSIALSVFLIGKLTENKIGYFVFQSTTSGVNLIMTANDKAYGGVASSILKDSTSIAFIENADSLTFKEKDALWKARSIEWIKQNPGKYAKLYLLKLGGLYIEDSWPDRPILGLDGFVDSYVVEKKVSKSAFISQVIIRGVKSLAYFFALIMFIYSIIVYRKSLLTEKSIFLILLAAGTFSTCLFAVSPRYHYPFLFTIILFSAYGIEHFIGKYFKKTGQ